MPVTLRQQRIPVYDVPNTKSLWHIQLTRAFMSARFRTHHYGNPHRATPTVPGQRVQYDLPAMLDLASILAYVVPGACGPRHIQLTRAFMSVHYREYHLKQYAPGDP